MLNKLLQTNAHLLIAGSVIGTIGALIGLHDVTASVGVPVIVAAAGLGALGASGTTKTP